MHRKTLAVTALALAALAGCGSHTDTPTGAQAKAPSQAPAVEPVTKTAPTPAADTASPTATASSTPTTGPTRKAAPNPAARAAEDFILAASLDEQSLKGATGRARVTELGNRMTDTAYADLVKGETAKPGSTVAIYLPASSGCTARAPYAAPGQPQFGRGASWYTAADGSTVVWKGTTHVDYLLTCAGQAAYLPVDRTWTLTLVPGTTTAHPYLVNGYTAAGPATARWVAGDPR